MQLILRRFMCATKCPRWSLKWWQAGQRNGMVASENRGAVRRQFIDFFHDNFRSIITQERWGMCNMSELCREAGL